MKHVGLNVAADPFMTLSLTGVNAGLVVVSADDPGMHSSQNEQDNRHYAAFAKVPLLEPADSQEAYDYVAQAFALSEESTRRCCCAPRLASPTAAAASCRARRSRWQGVNGSGTSPSTSWCRSSRANGTGWCCGASAAARSSPTSRR